MTRVAVFLPNWVGDAIQATPFLTALKARLGADSVLVGIGPPAVLEVLARHPALGAVRAKPKAGGKLRRLRHTIRLLRELEPDVAVLLTNDLPSAVASWLARVPRRVGYVRRGRGPFLTDRLHPPRQGRRFLPIPAVDYYLALAARLGWSGQRPPLSLASDPEGRAYAQGVIGAFRDLTRPLALINNSGAFGPAKLWTEEGVLGLSRALAGRGWNVLLLAGPAERAAVERLAREAGLPEVLAATRMRGPSLSLSKALVERAQLLVTTDSGPRHMGPAFGVRTVTLFGPTDPAWTDLATPLESWVRLGLDCQPCQQRDCPLGHHRCMKDLSLERVLAAL